MSRGANPPGETDGSEGLVGKPAEAARYIADLSGELAGLARAAGLEMLGYLLDIAQAEAMSKCPGAATGRRPRF
jgi:hypothetical protein